MPVDVDAYYRAYGPMVLRRCHRLLRNEQKAVDAMQDVFVQLLRHQARLDAEAPQGLLMRTATRICLNKLRTDSRRPEDEVDAALLEIAHAEDPERPWMRSFLEKLFAREQPSTRAIAVMHLVDGMTLDEVAREVGLSVSGIRKRLRTLKARVQALEAL